jgi:hypothetical protein
VLARYLESRILELAQPPEGGIPPSQRAIARMVGVARNTVGDRIKHGRRPASKSETQEMESGDETAAAGRRCPTCGAPLTVFPCRACRVRMRRRPVYHGIESNEPLRVDLEPAEAERLLDTLMMASGKIARDRPKPRVLRSRAFRFQLGTTGPVFFARLHPPIAVVG